MVQVFLSQMIYWQICPQRRCCPDTNNTMSALVSLLSWQPRYYLFLKNIIAWGSPAGSDVKESACNVGAWVRSLGQEDLMEKGRATHSSILDWRIPGTEDPGGLQSTPSQRVRHNWGTNTFTLTEGLLCWPVSISITTVRSPSCRDCHPSHLGYTWGKGVHLCQCHVAEPRITPAFGSCPLPTGPLLW